MDWSYQWQGIVEGMATPMGQLSVYILPWVVAAGATSTHLYLRRTARSKWSPVGVALLAYVAIWIVPALSSCGFVDKWLHGLPPTGGIPLAATLALPLLATLLALRRGYDCTWARAIWGAFLFAVTAVGATFVGMLFIPTT